MHGETTLKYIVEQHLAKQKQLKSQLYNTPMSDPDLPNIAREIRDNQNVHEAEIFRQVNLLSDHLGL